jgi:Heparinase II/III-like protein/Heparinase II/III N-terminus
MNLRWKLQRLRTMGVREVLFRVRRALEGHWQARQAANAAARLAQPNNPGDPGEQGQAWLDPRNYPQQGSYIYTIAADEILGGSFRLFGTPHALGFPPRWCTDPISGKRIGLHFGKTLDYRDVARHGDVRCIWEFNRHLELVTLAQAWQLSREPRFSAACESYLASWWDSNPYPMGPNWVSALEAALRLVNGSFAWHLLQDAPLFAGDKGRLFRQRWLQSVRQHTVFVRGYLSRHSSANNHLFGELAGIFVSGLTWPCWPQSRQWAAQAHAELVAQAQLQITPDGVNREQAVGYQHEVAELMVVCTLVGRANGVEFPASWWQRLHSSVAFLQAITNAAGQRPMWGDSDDACVYRLDPSPSADAYRSLAATVARLQPEAQLAQPVEGEPDVQTHWLLGNQPASRQLLRPQAQAIASRQSQRPALWHEGGYAVMGRDFGQASEVLMVADAGPLGYLGIAAHGHADALALTLSVAGQEVLVDPGTYAYAADAPWRKWFTGTAAHNTVCVGAADQAHHAGPFLWLSHYRAECIHWQADALGQHWVAEHNGYRRLAGKATHQRAVAYHMQSNCFTVTDTLATSASVPFSMTWQFHPGCQVVLAGQQAVVIAGPARVVIDLPAGTPWVLLPADGPPASADDVPGPGWFSPSFGRRVRAPALYMQGRTGAHGGSWVTKLLVA